MGSWPELDWPLTGELEYQRCDDVQYRYIAAWAGGWMALVSVASPSGTRERAAAAAARSPERAASGDTTSDAPTGEPSESSGESGG